MNTKPTAEPESRSGRGGPAGYELGERLEDSGAVYQGHHPRFSEPFVIKRLARVREESSAAAEAFSREAGRVSLLGHPNIALVLESGLLGDRTPFVAMERLSGWTLEERLTRLGPLSLPEVLPVLRGIVSALSAAHAVGVVHRELRPDNVFLLDHDHGPGAVKLLDFGVSRLTFASPSAGDDIGADAATYLAPEQRQDGIADVDARADQFALAALTYRMLSTVTSRCDAVLRRALSERRDHRFPTVALFFQAFEQAFAAGRAEATTPEIEIEIDVDLDVETFAGPPRRRAPLLVMAMMAAISVTGLAARGWGWRLPRAWRPSSASTPAAIMVPTAFAISAASATTTAPAPAPIPPEPLPSTNDDPPGGETGEGPALPSPTEWSQMRRGARGPSLRAGRRSSPQRHVSPPVDQAAAAEGSAPEPGETPGEDNPVPSPTGP